MSREAGGGRPRARPWRPGQFANLVLADTIGALLVGIGWYGSSGTGRVGTQIAWTNLAAAGTLLVAAANTIWLVAGRRAVAVRSHAIAGGLAHPLVPAIGPGPRPGAGSPASSANQLVASDTMRWYHRPDCLCARGKRLTDAIRAAHEQAGRAPCRVCRP